MNISFLALLFLFIGFIAGLAANAATPRTECTSYAYRWDDYTYMNPKAYAVLGYDFPSSITVK